ncbi:hypothetical protein ABI59_10890 [Acidobacteria bacterium Mor1]|nr:hypothetical protein ABI59_10890 [Acidobacteria bacterium Mor1]
MSEFDWKTGARLIHRHNRDLGVGRIVEIAGRQMSVEFARVESLLRFALDSDAVRPLEFEPGSRAELGESGETVQIEEQLDDAQVKLSDGRIVDSESLWPVDPDASLVQRLAAGDVDPPEDFALRLDALHLRRIREADGLGSFLGGRIQLFPHQLHCAERATRTDPVRWLLADEVGLGKTVEACLILNHLLRTGRADRTLVVAPATLTVQWLGELWRKYHQVFTLLDDKRLNDVEREYGKGFNPFEAHNRLVVSQEMLVAEPWLTERAVEAGIEMLIVDEAHHLKRAPGHPGSAEYRSVQPIAESARHVLLLTATPLEEDAHGFFRLLQLLRPDEFPEDVSFDDRLEKGTPLPPCTSSTRRADVGGFPPRQGVPIEIDGWDSWIDLERQLRSRPVKNALERKRLLDRIRRAHVSAASLIKVLRPADFELRGAAEALEEDDPRLTWLAEQAKSWRDNGDKTLVFVADRESLDRIRTTLRRVSQIRVGVFHEDLSPGQRDIEVAQFRLKSGPSMLVSTECGGEGRNFEFCTRMVLFDLPWDPMVVEQRIGRLDRIGRRRPVEIAYFRPPVGLGKDIAGLYEQLGLFRQPLGGVERELSGVRPAIEELALGPEDQDTSGLFDSIVQDARQAFSRVHEAAFQQLHQEPYTAELGPGILERVPPDLDELNEDVVLMACERLNLHTEPQPGEARHSVLLGNHARVDSLPGVPGGSNFLGTFDREEAVADETIDFYAAGHPLVEGLLAHLEDQPLGRVTLLRIAGDEAGFGLMAIFTDGPDFRAEAIDAQMRPRPDLAELLIKRPVKTKRLKAEHWVRRPEWAALVDALSSRLLDGRNPDALVAFQIDP